MDKPVKNNFEKDNSLDYIEYRFDPKIYENKFDHEPNFMSETNESLIVDEFKDNIGIYF